VEKVAVTDDGKPFLFLKRAPPSSIPDPKKGEVSLQKGIILSAFGPGLFALQNEVVLDRSPASMKSQHNTISGTVYAGKLCGRVISKWLLR
jgi:hypothetical protein